jgi:hypothetical protein
MIPITTFYIQAYVRYNKPAIDPYVAVQDAYIQNRVKKKD